MFFFNQDFSYFALLILDPLNLELVNQAKNIPVVRQSFPIIICGKSVIHTNNQKNKQRLLHYIDYFYYLGYR